MQIVKFTKKANYMDSVAESAYIQTDAYETIHITRRRL